MKKLPIGISDFQELRQGNQYLIDKSLLIEKIINENAKIVLLPRPRRFGKTLNLSMLRYFFEKSRGQSHDREENRKLFSGLFIEKEKSFEKHLGKHPVIYLTFKDIKAQNFKKSKDLIRRLISNEFRRRGYLFQSDALSDVEKKDFKAVFENNSDDLLFETSLHDLSRYLYKTHKLKPVILIDEYDTPIHTAYNENYYDEAIAFFKGFLGAGLKDNPNIFKGVLTGILRVAKESIFSDMNNLGVYSLLRQEYADDFGFTENEVLALLTDYGAGDRMEDAKRWYDGYIFGEKTIYNPWSIINFASSADKVCRPYWANTSSDQMIKSLIRHSPHSVQKELYNLLKDIPITKKMEENVAFDDLTQNDGAVFSFLLFCGYLKAFDPTNVDHEDHRKLLAPNLEVKQILKNVISKWMDESWEPHKLKEMLNALVTGDAETFEELLGNFVLETLSYFDVAGKNVEKVYQAFLLGLLVNLSADYDVSSERESGYGRYDICVVPKKKDRPAIVMELKTIRKNETKEKALENALRQINEKEYETAIQKTGIRDIIKMGVVFDGKRVWIKGEGLGG